MEAINMIELIQIYLKKETISILNIKAETFRGKKSLFNFNKSFIFSAIRKSFIVYRNF